MLSISVIWKTETLDVSPSEAGGYKEIQFKVKGDKVYSLMKFESGVHRVQRVPVTESQGRIQTSAAGVLVDLFTGWTFSISMGAGLGMLGGIVLGALLDQQPPAS